MSTIPTTTISTSITADYDTGIYMVNAAAGAITITLPVILCDGQKFVFIRTDNSANTVTIVAGAGNNIDGQLSIVLQNFLTSNYMTITSFVVNWYVDIGPSSAGDYAFNFQGFRFTGPSTFASNFTLALNATATITWQALNPAQGYFFSTDNCYNQATGIFTTNANTAGLWNLSCNVEASYSSGTATANLAVLRLFKNSVLVASASMRPFTTSHYQTGTVNATLSLASGDTFTFDVINSGSGTGVFLIQLRNVSGFKVRS